LSSTIGYERKFNNFLQFTDAKSFTDFAIKTAPPVPRYYPLMKKVNAKGPEVLGGLPRVPGLPQRGQSTRRNASSWLSGLSPLPA